MQNYNTNSKNTKQKEKIEYKKHKKHKFDLIQHTWVVADMWLDVYTAATIAYIQILCISQRQKLEFYIQKQKENSIITCQ